MEMAFVSLDGKATTVLSPGILYNVVALALQLLDGADAGSQWLTWALSLRLAVASKPHHNNTTQVTLMGRLFTIAPLDAAMTKRLECWICFGAHVRTVLLRPPRTFLAWRECVQALQTGIIESRLVPKGGLGKYDPKWLCRSLCLFAMARAGIPHLEVMEATGSHASVPFLEAQSWDELSRWFPNRCNWGGHLAGTVDVSVAMQSLGYRGRPELLTLWLRLASDARLNTFISEAGICRVRGRDISPEEFQQAALESLQVNGIPSNPMRLLESMSACEPVLRQTGTPGTTTH